MAKDDKKKKTEHEDVVDLAARIGARQGEPTPPEVVQPQVPPPPPPTRLDGPIPSAPKPRLVPAKEDRAQGAMIQKALVEEEKKPEAAIPSPRAAPGPGFELAIRKVRGVGQLRTEYYRHGVLKVRVSYQGTDRLAAALRAGIPGYRVRVIGEDRATLQILVTSEGDERRPG